MQVVFLHKKNGFEEAWRSAVYKKHGVLLYMREIPSGSVTITRQGNTVTIVLKGKDPQISTAYMDALNEFLIKPVAASDYSSVRLTRLPPLGEGVPQSVSRQDQG